MTASADEPTPFDTRSLTDAFAEVAQDGSRYDGLLGTQHAWLSDCQLVAHATTRAVRHLAHDEIWFVRSGSGLVWRSVRDRVDTVEVTVGSCLTIPARTAFQFRTGDEELRALIMQAPPWPPAPHPAFEYVDGPWVATV